MDFALTEHQRSIDESVRRVCGQFEDLIGLIMIAAVIFRLNFARR
ncbi:MAG: hypothetical protein CM1200mP41_30760 [Gammaproteobacteria bacterium]|nr:MAG: hypothetical protein CM1200mP41_30760 [Gammaproteobacteria bacterium]